MGGGDLGWIIGMIQQVIALEMGDDEDEEKADAAGCAGAVRVHDLWLHGDGVGGEICHYD